MHLVRDASRSFVRSFARSLVHSFVRSFVQKVSIFLPARREPLRNDDDAREGCGGGGGVTGSPVISAIAFAAFRQPAAWRESSFFVGKLFPS